MDMTEYQLVLNEMIEATTAFVNENAVTDPDPTVNYVDMYINRDKKLLTVEDYNALTQIKKVYKIRLKEILKS